MGESFLGDDMRELVNGKPVYMNRGYRVVYAPDSISRRWVCYIGYMYEHRYIMEKHLGHEIPSTFVVHHKDGNKSNNQIDNLEVMPMVEHSRSHSYRNGNSRRARCSICGKQMKTPIGLTRRQMCRKCYNKQFSPQHKHNIRKEELIRLLEKYNFTEIGRMYSVTGNAVRKWARKYGIDGLALIRKHGTFSDEVLVKFRKQRVFEHGTFTMYKHGCRCQMCVDAMRASERAKWEKRKVRANEKRRAQRQRERFEKRMSC